MSGIANYFICFALQVAATLGIILIFGIAIAFCNRRFYRGFGAKSTALCRITGIIGTPIHEASHALFCIIFRHKITEVKLFSISSDDGTLGYVHHSYNPKSLYQRIGNLFIGIAPIVVGALILCGLLFLLVPDLFKGVCGEILLVDFLADTVASFGHIGRAFLICFAYLGSWQWWLFLLLGAFIALHMTLSKADVKGALSGVVFYLLLLLAVDAILAAIGDVITAFTGYILIFGSFMLFFLVLFVAILLILIAVQRLLGLIFKKRR